ncbi:MAG: hypothetical protein U1A27_14875 [Phycisphaerae bacterium]
MSDSGTDSKLGEQQQRELGKLISMQEALQLLESLKKSVVEELERTATPRLVKETSQAVVDRLHKNGDVIKMFDKEASARTKTMLAWMGAVVGVLTIAGVTLVPTIIGSVIRGMAEREVRNQYKDEKGEFIKIEEGIRATAASATASMNLEVSLALSRFRVDAIKESNDAAEKLKSVGRNTQEELSEQFRSQRERDESNRKSVEQFVKNSLEDFIKRKADYEGAISTARTVAIYDIHEAAASVIRQISNKQENISLSSSPRRSVGSGTTEPSGGPSGFEPTKLLTVMSAIGSRDYEHLVETASKLVVAGTPEFTARVLQPMIVRMNWFAEEDRPSGAKMLLDDSSADPGELYGTLTELLICATREGDEKLYKSVNEKINENPISRVTTNDLIDFVRAVHDGRRDEAERAYDTMKSLTGRGYTNVLLLAKKARLSDPKLRDCERNLLDSLEKTNLIDRPSDYPLAWLVVTALTTEPIDDRERIVRGLERIKRIVLTTTRPDDDPWELGKLIDDFVNKAATSQP